MKYPLSLNTVFSLTTIISVFSFISCGTNVPVIKNQTAPPAVAQLLDEEIKRFENSGVIHIESIYYNPHIKGFLTAYSNGDRNTTDQLKGILTDSEINAILNAEEVAYLIQQLENHAKVPSTLLMTSQKVILEDLHDKKDKDLNNNQRILNIDKNRMIISTPVFTRDKQFALIDVSKGKLNNMYTTINLYQKEGDTYVFSKTLLGYME